MLRLGVRSPSAPLWRTGCVSCRVVVPPPGSLRSRFAIFPDVLMTPALILGGYGTFGAHVARALAQRGIPLVVAGRDGNRAASFAGSLGPAHRGLAFDFAAERTWHDALRDGPVVVNCAGSLA